MEVFQVGGSVRDELLGFESQDRDWVVVNSSPEEMEKNGFKPWFHYESNAHTKKNQYFVFGHWASLSGKTNDPYFIGLDTGCAWKEKLTALRLNDLKKISVNY